MENGKWRMTNDDEGASTFNIRHSLLSSPIVNTPENIPSWPHGPTGFERRFGNATTRVATAVVAIPIVLGAVWYGGLAFFLFVAAIGSGALLEFYWITEKKGAHPQKWIGVIAGLTIIYAFMHGPQMLFKETNVFEFSKHESIRLLLLLGALVLLTFPMMIAEMFRGRGSSTLNITATLAGVLYVSVPMGTLLGLRNLETAASPHAQFPILVVAAVIVTIWVCDSAAYYTGRAFGRHKLFERISPKKTWEGAIGGAVFAVLAMIGAQQWLLHELRIVDAVAIGLIVGVLGQLGDLAESQLKRDAGVKDSSQLIPGHGGLLDRFDSLIFVAPFVYLYFLFLFRPL